jgi:phage tail-like protein
MNRITTNAAERTSMSVALLDESGSPTMVWRLANAWPVKITGPDLKADGNDVAIETLEIAHEGLVVRKA